MKMRSSIASRGICISASFRVQRGAEDVTEPHGDHARGYGKDNIPTGVQPFAVAKQVERFAAERGERGVTAADAEHEELCSRRADEAASAGFGPRGEKADQERAGDIDGEGAPGKCFAPLTADGAGD